MYAHKIICVTADVQQNLGKYLTTQIKEEIKEEEIEDTKENNRITPPPTVLMRIEKNSEEREQQQQQLLSSQCGRRFAHPNSVRNHMRIKHTLQWAKMKAMRSSGGPFAGGPDFK
uniref:C2H2-type domain-containing protein n=1 Tax=Glossina brevipalpis TaxID=37001 RepID=A0A1A9WHN4_9MUSC